jgi:hypothetical protein
MAQNHPFAPQSWRVVRKPVACTVGDGRYCYKPGPGIIKVEFVDSLHIRLALNDYHRISLNDFRKAIEQARASLRVVDVSTSSIGIVSPRGEIRPCWRKVLLQVPPITNLATLGGVANGRKCFVLLVPGGGLEPPRPCGLRILSPLCLPISPSGRYFHEEDAGALFACSIL